MNKTYFVYNGVQYHIGSNGKYYKRPLHWNNRPGWENFFIEISYISYVLAHRRARKTLKRLIAECFPDRHW